MRSATKFAEEPETLSLPGRQQQPAAAFDARLFRADIGNQLASMTDGNAATFKHRDCSVRLSDDLANRSEHLLKEFERSDVYSRFFHSLTDPSAIQIVSRRLLFEVATYGPWVTSATFTAIGRVSQIWPDVITPFAEHLLEEVPHPRLAMEGFLELGGDKREAAAAKLSPASFALASVCCRIAEQLHPLSYLGYVYLLESTTVTLGLRLKELLESANRDIQFISKHATEDVGHTQKIATGIDAVCEARPDARQAIIDSFDYFSAVYPLPIWSTALHAGQRELALK